jgi:hypothetical protein
MQVIYRCTNTLRSWSALHHANFHDLFMEVCTRLEDTARDLFICHGWQHDLQLDPPSAS